MHLQLPHYIQAPISFKLFQIKI